MKYLLSSLTFYFLVCTTFAQTDQSKPIIALLGTFHFAGSTGDAMALKVDDIMSEKRQKEIDALVSSIVTFKPTKVILEYPYGDDGLDSVYQLYREGKYELKINERQQLGFRIANQLGHEHIYVADYHLDLPFNELTQYLQETNQMHLMQNMMSYIKTNAIDVMQEAYNNMELTEFFQYINQDKFDHANIGVYVEYLNHIGANQNDIGIKVNTLWWERNFRIMKNIDMQLEERDRAFVLFGQGHTAILKGFYQARRDVDYIDILDYLK